LPACAARWAVVIIQSSTTCLARKPAAMIPLHGACGRGHSDYARGRLAACHLVLDNMIIQALRCSSESVIHPPCRSPQVGAQRFDGGNWRAAADLFAQMATSPQCPDFLTLPAYDAICRKDTVTSRM